MRLVPFGVTVGLLATALACAAVAQTPGQAPAPAQTQSQRKAPPAPKNLQVLPKDTTLKELIPKMRFIAKSLGVECSFCHVRGDFSADTKDTKQIARKMLRMVDAINTQNFSGRAEVSCYTCHRGSTKPLSQPPAEPASGGR